jgi:hypothetical protein
MDNLSDTIALILVLLVPCVTWFTLRRTAWYKSWFVGTADERPFAEELLVIGGKIILSLVVIGLVGLIAAAIVLWAWRTVFGHGV